MRIIIHFERLPPTYTYRRYKSQKTREIEEHVLDIFFGLGSC